MYRRRFVILTHDHPFLHWDLMLEGEGGLRTWRLLKEPAAGSASPAERLADHRTAYLDYEGPVSAGRGTVTRWDQGTYEIVSETDDELRTTLAGVRLQGRATLTVGPSGTVWTFSLCESNTLGVRHAHPA
jgi:hypothetical protein